jgi:hypothetical protein
LRIPNVIFHLATLTFRAAWHGVVILQDGPEFLPDHLRERLKLGGRALDLEPGFRLLAGGIDLEDLDEA